MLLAVGVVVAACGGPAGPTPGAPDDVGASGSARFEPEPGDSEESGVFYAGSGRASPPVGVFVDVSASGLRTCGVRDRGEIECWGDWEGFSAVSLAEGVNGHWADPTGR